ncbi:MAG: ROK family glucokinase [Lachnospiraceae bacterium]|jgi:glucokinase|nr:ROK family glucokinase [Lachnospiraceae bacterium]
MAYCFGVDVGGTSIKLGLFFDNGSLIDNWEIPTRKESQGENIIPDIRDAVENKMTEKEIIRSEVIGVGVDVPAPVLDEGIVKETANLNWGYKEVKKELEEALLIPVVVANDANAAALGEAWMGGGKGENNLIMITLGTGVGGGIISNGKLISGAHGFGGEIGHIHVKDGELCQCGCGRYGCLEQYASATGISRLANEHFKTWNKETKLSEKDLSARAVFDAYKMDDKLAAEIVDEFAGYLVKGMHDLEIIIDPAVFLIGGGVSKAGEVLVDVIEKKFRRNVLFTNENTKITLATLGNEAGIYGSAKLVIDEFGK